jgi:hypothetical protein
MNLYLVSHNGLGDNITNSSAIRYLSYFYNNIFLICKDIYKENNELMFNNLNNILIVTVSQYDDINESCSIINNLVNNSDVFISGNCFTNILKSKITNQYLNNYVVDNDIYENCFEHIKNFYNDINLDLTIYYDFFYIPPTELSKELYNSIKHYVIYFLHTQSSCKNIVINNNIIDKISDEENIIFIDINNNYYKLCKETNIIKYNLANNFININMIHYLDTIINSKYIYIVDSCVSCMIYPLYRKKLLNAEYIKIFDRNTNEEIQIMK